MKYLKRLRFLRLLILAKVAVTGDLRAIAGCNHLRSLTVQAANVTGDLKSVVRLRRLRALDMEDLDFFTGHIKSLQYLIHLVVLKLIRLALTGDLLHVGRLHVLQRLRVLPVITNYETPPVEHFTTHRHEYFW